MKQSPMKFHLREGANGWERWDNAAETWQPLRPPYDSVEAHDARLYVAGWYGVRPQQVRIIGRDSA